MRGQGGREGLEHSSQTVPAKGLPHQTAPLPRSEPTRVRGKDSALPWFWCAAVLGLVLGRPAQGEGVACREPLAQATVASFSWSLCS